MKKSGFSLIELSLTLIVVASLALIAMTKMVAEQEVDRKLIVMNDLDKIKKAIQSFAERNGYYPCPADPTLPSTDPNSALSSISIAPSVASVGQRCGGLSIQNSTPVVTNEFAFTGSTNGLQSCCNSEGQSYQFIIEIHPRYPDILEAITPIADILMGDVPCKDIGLEPDCGVSPEGNKYSYIVSGQLTMVPSNDFLNNSFVSGCSKSCVWGGAPGAYDELSVAARIKPVKIWDRTVGNLPTDYAANGFPEVDFAVIDHGKNGLGAFNTAGVRNSDVGATNYERLNFKQAATGYVNEFIYAPIQPNDVRTASNTNFYDDIVVLGKQDSLISARYCLDCREHIGVYKFRYSFPFDQLMTLTNSISSCADPAIQTICEEALP